MKAKTFDLLDLHVLVLSTPVARLGSNLPADIRCCSSIVTFGPELQTHLFVATHADA